MRQTGVKMCICINTYRIHTHAYVCIHMHMYTIYVCMYTQLDWRGLGACLKRRLEDNDVTSGLNPGLPVHLRQNEVMEAVMKILDIVMYVNFLFPEMVLLAFFMLPKMELEVLIYSQCFILETGGYRCKRIRIWTHKHCHTSFWKVQSKYQMM